MSMVNCVDANKNRCAHYGTRCDGTYHAVLFDNITTYHNSGHEFICSKIDGMNQREDHAFRQNKLLENVVGLLGGDFDGDLGRDFGGDAYDLLMSGDAVGGNT